MNKIGLLMLAAVVSKFLLIMLLNNAVADEINNKSVDAEKPVTNSIEKQKQQQVEFEAAVSNLKKPMYTPFVENFILNELKALRISQAQNKQELFKEVMDREHQAIDRAVRYSTDTITYFFYIITGVTSIVLFVGWSSIRDIKDKISSVADQEINKVIKEYVTRLEDIEKQLQNKHQSIVENREEIEVTQEVEALWRRAMQESSAAQKVAIYDEILKLKPNDVEAYSYKADAVLELNELRWAISLCHQALAIEPENSHAFYQLACAYSMKGAYDEAVKYLKKSVMLTENYREHIMKDDSLIALHNHPEFIALVEGGGE